MTRYRWTPVPTGARSGDWKPTRVEAEEDAIACDMAEREEDGSISLDILVEIESDEWGQPA